ncbi:hypothetical protein GUITHDRAFT_104609 [Guillardia theta CCMP2712]|uniref:Uncharacterized protein n=1 Tax=Guillardia theta (strain CCMP2712) TaxID=905079 RepID=L1JNJ3_GUITC|nr:hypothetical protein GUITHDRAFT_104609 [Guillardia theta CCMP2712]EKX49648.1 hypothetical protein GUITHDRAFT_104609 [Guillardia theta CCMP2712]|eukprot:XP_005836628.1 hypothetical protein GUITHDRAFT_104609 [Guillardia theta CCMP2712]
MDDWIDECDPILRDFYYVLTGFSDDAYIDRHALSAQPVSMIRRLFSRSSLVRPARCEVDVEEGTANGVKSELEIIPAGSADGTGSSQFSRRKLKSREGSKWRSFKSLFASHKAEPEQNGASRPPRAGMRPDEEAKVADVPITEYPAVQVVVDKQEEEVSPTAGRAKVAWDTGHVPKVSKIPLKRWEGDEEVLKMARYLGIKEGEDYLLGIAEEALNATLPSGWEERSTAEGYPFYFWFLVKSIRKMKHQRSKKGPQVARSPEVRRDREIADSLWRMHEEEKQREEVKKCQRLSEEEPMSGSLGTN